MINIKKISLFRISRLFSVIFSSIILLVLTSSCSEADVGRLMENYVWKSRGVLIFTPAVENAEYQKQKETLIFDYIIGRLY